MNPRPASLVIACAVAFIAWRCVATADARVRHAAAAPFAARAAWLVADRDARVASTFGADAAIVRAIDANLRPRSKLLIYGTPQNELAAMRDRLVLLQIRSYFLFYPTEVLMAIGPIEDAARFANVLNREMWLLNVSPEVERPLADLFEVVVRGDGFELSRFVGPRP